MSVPSSKRFANRFEVDQSDSSVSTNSKRRKQSVAAATTAATAAAIITAATAAPKSIHNYTNCNVIVSATNAYINPPSSSSTEIWCHSSGGNEAGH